MEVVSGNKNIYSSLSVAKDKARDLLLNICSILQSNSYNDITKCVVDYCMFIPIRASKQMGT